MSKSLDQNIRKKSACLILITKNELKLQIKLYTDGLKGKKETIEKRKSFGQQITYAMKLEGDNKLPACVTRDAFLISAVDLYLTVVIDCSNFSQ
jgi:hypothetical protein